MHNQLQKNHNLLALINNEGKTLLYLKRSVFSGCGESLLHSLFLCLNLFLSLIKKESDTRMHDISVIKKEDTPENILKKLNEN